MSIQPVQVPFPLCLWTHDPSGQPMDYSVPLPVPPTFTVTNVTVSLVDASDALLTTGVPTVTNITWAIANNVWYATFWLAGGVPGTLYNLRVRWTLSDGRGSDRTVSLLCAHT